jgi:acyl-CoA reductase-like NAD-dependent aldehyde dehydrogenase
MDDQLNLIAGEHREAASGLTLLVIDPADGQPFTTLPRRPRSMATGAAAPRPNAGGC